jgi:hypothetical protein
VVHTGCRWGRAAAVVDTEVKKEVVVDAEDTSTMARSGGGGGSKNMELELQV